ncbi:hypothetical protein JCM10212_005727 [Sporobolomyces blumeae]
MDRRTDVSLAEHGWYNPDPNRDPNWTPSAHDPEGLIRIAPPDHEGLIPLPAVEDLPEVVSTEHHQVTLGSRRPHTLESIGHDTLNALGTASFLAVAHDSPPTGWFALMAIFDQSIGSHDPIAEEVARYLIVQPDWIHFGGDLNRNPHATPTLQPLVLPTQNEIRLPRVDELFFHAFFVADAAELAKREHRLATHPVPLHCVFLQLYFVDVIQRTRHVRTFHVNWNHQAIWALVVRHVELFQYRAVVCWLSQPAPTVSHVARVVATWTANRLQANRPIETLNERSPSDSIRREVYIGIIRQWGLARNGLVSSSDDCPHFPHRFDSTSLTGVVVRVSIGRLRPEATYFEVPPYPEVQAEPGPEFVPGTRDKKSKRKSVLKAVSNVFRSRQGEPSG